ncbi:MAG: hypothetical protein WKF73_15820 [Nocardioidaceae bacterium]
MSQDWPGRAAVLSSELFVYLSREEAAKALSSFRDTQVHVIYTARDLVRQAPAVWQERIKNQYVLGYSDFLDDLLGPVSSKMSKGFWRAQDAVTALARWSQGLDPSQVHVVTAPPSGSPPGVLWERFASVIGLNPGTYSTEVPPANPSMSPLAAETLRRFNQRRGSQLTKRRYGRLVKSDLVQVLLSAVEDDTKLTLDSRQHEALTQRSTRLVSGLEAAGYDVVGSLDELLPTPAASTRRNLGRGPDQVTDAEVIDALNDVVFDLLKSVRRDGSRGGRNAAELDDVGTEG